MKARDAVASFRRPSVARMLSVLTLSAGALLVGSVSTALAQFDAVVVQDEVDMRAGAGRSYYALGKITKDQRVQVLRVRYGWYQVLAPQGVSLFVEKDQLELAADGKTAKVTAAQAPAFLAHPQGPGASTQEAAQLKRGTPVTVLGTEGGFARIEPIGETPVYLPPGALRRVMDQSPVVQPVNARGQEAAPVVDLVVAEESKPTPAKTGGEWWQAHDVHPRVQTVDQNAPEAEADVEAAQPADIAQVNPNALKADVDPALEADFVDADFDNGPVIEPFGAVPDEEKAEVAEATPAAAPTPAPVQAAKPAPSPVAAKPAAPAPAVAKAAPEAQPTQSNLHLVSDRSGDSVASAFALALADRPNDQPTPRATNAMNTSDDAAVTQVLHAPIKTPAVEAPAEQEVRIDPAVEADIAAASADKWSDADAAEQAAVEAGAGEASAEKAAADADLDPEIEKQITAVSPELRVLEREMIRTLAQPLELQPIGKLTQQYEAMYADGALSRADQWIVRTRLAQLSRNAQLQEAIEKLSGMRTDRSATAVREEIANKPEPKVVYDHVGVLLASGVYDGVKLPRLLRLVHPQSQRTLGYVKPNATIDLAAVLGQRVGIVGEQLEDPQVGRTVIDPTRIDAIGQ